ncbi:hypothetical protein CORC01_09955 [Colletotrichum orchidophilum]|uniref:Uncharacterized protein n=1 Tax=Colletotrichum orchidophilum TaxID=1209926 RepID=A0A1G4AZZ5_9PEZI|nr:uncharacterized protein CORC01_09955 [Colletotrichum orchidophilum]OHE94738.1 hypothetical protein CORC01_09955 [Colletotrichum orchidophilum]
MDSSHHYSGMFPPAYSTGLAPYPRPVIPAKREDDDVQFVSSNPVKKRRIDDYQPVTQHSTTKSPALGRPVPISHQTSEAAKPTSQPERRGSTGMVDHSPTARLPDVDPMRGCSMPTPERSCHSESFWTSPCTGEQSSPPVSPKSLPEPISPSVLGIENSHGPAPSIMSGTNETVADFPGPVPSLMASSHLYQAQVSGEQGTPSQFQPETENHTETAKDVPSAPTAPALAGVTDQGNTNSVPASVADGKTIPHQTAESGPMLTYPCAEVESKNTTRDLLDQQADLHSSKINDFPFPFHTHTHQTTNVSSPLTSEIYSTIHGTSDNQTGACADRPASGAKGPCRQCVEVRLRQQAASMAANSGLTNGTKASTTSQTPLPPSSIQQPWTHLLGLNPYHNAMAGAIYNPLLQQSLMAGPAGHFAVHSQQPHLGPTLPAQQPAGHMFHLGPPSPVPQAQAFAAQQPTAQPAKPATAISKPQKNRLIDTQPATKHIIVDIADTCLNMFPFQEVAKRHNQPEQKVRDIFSAVIQVPLLRCPTDKRRAGKLGTTRVKEFTQAKKEVQAQKGNPGQTRQDSPNQMPYMPSAWDVAQFIGPSDVRLGALPKYSPLW